MAAGFAEELHGVLARMRAQGLTREALTAAAAIAFDEGQGSDASAGAGAAGPAAAPGLSDALSSQMRVAPPPVRNPVMERAESADIDCIVRAPLVTQGPFRPDDLKAVSFAEGGAKRLFALHEEAAAAGAPPAPRRLSGSAGGSQRARAPASAERK